MVTLSAVLAFELYRETHRMRLLQRKWFGGDKSRPTLIACREAERRVDAVLTDIEASLKQPELMLEDTPEPDGKEEP